MPSCRHTSRPSIYTTVSVAEAGNGCLHSTFGRGRANACIDESTRKHNAPRTYCHYTVVVGGRMVGGGGSWDSVVFQQWSERVGKCAYATATHAGSTVSRLSFSVSGDSRLNTQSHVWSPVATARVKDVTERDGLLVTLRLCTPACLVGRRGNETSPSSQLTRGGSGGMGRGGRNMWPVTARPLPREKGREREVRQDTSGLSLWKLPCLPLTR